MSLLYKLRTRVGDIHRRRLADAFAWEKQEYRLILSTGRTGTDFLANLIEGGFEGATAVHEPHPDLFDLGIRYRRNGLSIEEAARLLRTARVEYIEKCSSENSIYVETNNNLSLLTPVVPVAFPSPVVVHLVRDGRDWITSSFSKRQTRDPDSPLFLSDQDNRSRLNARDFPEDPLATTWNETDRFEQLCWYWNKMNRMIMLESADLGATVIKFEDIFNAEEGYPGLTKLLRVFGLMGAEEDIPLAVLDKMSSRRNASVSKNLPSFEGWTATQKEVFDSYCGRTRSELGYA